MEVVLTLAVVSLVLIFVLPKLQSYMRMLIEEHDEMEKLS